MVESATLNVQAGVVIRHWKVDVFFSFSPCPQNVSDLGEGELLDWFSPPKLWPPEDGDAVKFPLLQMVPQPGWQKVGLLIYAWHQHCNL